MKFHEILSKNELVWRICQLGGFEFLVFLAKFISLKRKIQPKKIFRSKRSQRKQEKVLVSGYIQQERNILGKRVQKGT